ncbi:Arc family DNA-binding protein [Ketobacter sp. MCCC 1A13808]|uniref:FitA-like ribbon-helix-helix domain-containing protein n=1 Tax=Ketobacter sp. MCCC 1A13808 TaxID=2602738 RepID=UPI0012EB5709|nr:Arc family DNA-binding protein [Ketobacter sp. MCCC 1A13808]MVF13393.1 Arc family DNA-binding protein [Ketobacter sp. MCCC 1A13808]
MASLTIKNIPDDLYEHLKQAANAHHRSINSELIYCLERTLLPTKLSSSDLKEAAKLLRGRVLVKRIDVDEINSAKNEGRE